jgi:hypothetical protein
VQIPDVDDYRYSALATESRRSGGKLDRGHGRKDHIRQVLFFHFGRNPLEAARNLVVIYQPSPLFSL